MRLVCINVLIAFYALFNILQFMSTARIRQMGGEQSICHIYIIFSVATLLLN